MRVFNEVAELMSAAGEELGTSDWLILDQERIDTFADATGDHQGSMSMPLERHRDHSAERSRTGY